MPNKIQKKQRTITKPELDKVTKDLMGTIQNMHESLREIDRIDPLIFPLLEMDEEERFIQQPDFKADPKLAAYVRVIAKIID